MSLRLRSLLAVGLAALSSATHLTAFEPDGYPIWPDGTITMHLQMGNSPALMDGSTWNTSLDEALKQWNRNLGRVQFASVIGSSASVSRGNGRNNVVFRNDVYGEEFGENVLAVTLSSTNGTHRTESDVIFNQAEKWDSYRGALNYSKSDIRRVALHEFGHVLGLTHPDQAGQYVTAVMNSTTSDVDGLRTDDQDGAAALYGPGVDNPIPPPTISSQPNPQSVTEGQSTGFYVYADGRVLSYQWRKNGTPIPGATNFNYTIDPVQMADAGAYSVVVSNPGGSVTSNDALLTVTAATPPVIDPKMPADLSVEAGQRANFSAWGVSGSYPMSYQWYKDGVAIAGATDFSLEIDSVSAASMGAYSFEARNIAGSARSRGAVLTVLPIALPPKTSISTSGRMVLGRRLGLSVYSPSTDRWYSYQWYKDGQAIAGATDYSLSFAALKPEDAGEYLVVITNAAGATSSNALRVDAGAVDKPVGAWSSAKQYDTVCYFLYTNPARIERYDVRTGWLAPITLEGTPTALSVDASGIHVATGRSVWHYALDGTAGRIVATVSLDIKDLVVSTDYVFAFQSEGYSTTRSTTIRRSDGAIVADSGSGYGNVPSGLSFAPTLNRIFRHDQSYITYVNIKTDGTFGSSGSGPYGLPDASRTWVRGDESQVADDSGTVYASSDLSVLGSLGGPVTDLASHDSGWIALRADTLVHYDQRLLETGRTKLPRSGLTLFVVGDDAWVFTAPDPTTREVSVIPCSLSTLAPPPATPAIDPRRRLFPVDNLFLDDAGVVHITSRAFRNVFRWSIGERRFLDSIPLRAAPSFVTYSPVTDNIFVGYENVVTRIAASAGSSEEVFVVSPLQLRGIAALSRHLLVHTTMMFEGFTVYDESGQKTSSSTFPPASGLSVWNWTESTRRLHTMGYSSLYLYEVLSDGTFGATTSVYYGTAQFREPIRNTPDGGHILLSTGIFHDAKTLQISNALPAPIDDAAWLGDTLYTAFSKVDGIYLRRWSAVNYAETGSLRLPGRVLRLFPWGDDKLVLVGLRDGYLFFAVIGADLSILSIDENKSLVRLANLSSRAQVGTGDKVLISGFVIAGSGKKSLLLRAVGPTLTDYGVTGELANPRLTLFNSQGSPIDTNDDWSSAPNLDELVSRSKAIGAAGLRAASKDAALLTSLDPGLYTVHVTGVSDTTGVGLVELFDADNRDSTARLINISTRAQVGAGDGILIPGIVVDGDAPVTVLIRAVGPSLVKHGVSDALADPQFQILDRDAKVIASNDDWWSGTDLDLLNVTSKQVGAGTLDTYSKDAAVVATLPPGIYTVHVKGVNNTTGVALVEVFYASP